MQVAHIALWTNIMLIPPTKPFITLCQQSEGFMLNMNPFTSAVRTVK